MRKFRHLYVDNAVRADAARIYLIAHAFINRQALAADERSVDLRAAFYDKPVARDARAVFYEHFIAWL